MCCYRQKCSDHTGFEDKGPRYQQVMSLGYSGAGENVAWNGNAVFAEQMVAQHTSWMEPPAHKDNIMNGEYTSVGYGFCVGAASPKGDTPTMYHTAIFGK